MQCLGIDVGTDSVRLYVPGNEGKASFYETQLARTSSGRYHTMSATGLWESIMTMFAKEKNIYKALQRSFETHRMHNSKEGREMRNQVCNEVSEVSEVSDVSDVSEFNEVSKHNQDKQHNQDKKHNKYNQHNQDNKAIVPRFGVSIGATCSMVVMERVFENGAFFFRPLEPGHEIIVWMDTRAQHEADLATRLLPEWALQQIGGRVTPEMGIAKLLYVDKFYKAHNKKVCVFELYDWVSYVFLAGGYQEGQVRCLGQDEPIFSPGKSAMDGSVKGWSAELLHSLGISAKVVATPNSIDPSNVFPHVGTPLGTIGDFVVGHGCIDCYAPWAGLVASQDDDFAKGAPCANPAIPKTSLLMVAGTSTCFIASSDGFIASSDNSMPIQGFWGPFWQLSSQPVYTFGQPATGQLFAALLQEFRDIVPNNEDPFEFMEHHAQDFEAKYNAPLTVLARHYFYYGDKHGNRSPYGDFQMDEVYTDGVNSASNNTFQCSIREKSLEALVLRYYLTLEFLILQTTQLCSNLAASCGSISTVHLEGSQAQNRRFVDLLKSFVFPQARLFIRRDKTSKFSGCRGISAALRNKLITAKLITGDWCEVKPSGPDMERDWHTVQDILAAKHEAFLQLAQWQASLRKNMKNFNKIK